MANAILEHDAKITIPAPNIANTIPVNRIRSITGPSWSRMIDATGEALALTRAMSLVARVRVGGGTTLRILWLRPG